MYISVSGEPIFDADGSFKGYRGVGRDVTHQRLAEQQVLKLARYDGLTGLPNRSMFVDELERTLARARRSGQAFALFFIDLDRFKNINDSLGHDAGDQLLKVMATRLRELLRDSDLVARLGGDEFVVLLEGSVDAGRAGAGGAQGAGGDRRAGAHRRAQLPGHRQRRHQPVPARRHGRARC